MVNLFFVPLESNEKTTEFRITEHPLIKNPLAKILATGLKSQSGVSNTFNVDKKPKKIPTQNPEHWMQVNNFPSRRILTRKKFLIPLRMDPFTRISVIPHPINM